MTAVPKPTEEKKVGMTKPTTAPAGGKKPAAGKDDESDDPIA